MHVNSNYFVACMHVPYVSMERYFLCCGFIKYCKSDVALGKVDDNRRCYSGKDVQLHQMLVS